MLKKGVNKLFSPFQVIWNNFDFFCLTNFFASLHFFCGGEYGTVIFFQEIVYLCYPNAIYRIFISYYAWNILKSLCGCWWGGVGWGGVGRCKPILVFSFGQAEQNGYFKVKSKKIKGFLRLLLKILQHDFFVNQNQSQL